MGYSFDTVGKGKFTESINNGMILMISYKFNYVRKRKNHQRSEIRWENGRVINYDEFEGLMVWIRLMKGVSGKNRIRIKNNLIRIKNN